MLIYLDNPTLLYRWLLDSWKAVLPKIIDAIKGLEPEQARIRAESEEDGPMLQDKPKASKQQTGGLPQEVVPISDYPGEEGEREDMKEPINQDDI
ncbi:hypothetical protein BDZ91DRAFT_790560 [Kalaharituber pfeilii]|nr:hypothetical protein BDZ91DRAFT_790560 [Kalaharituber pfeilii]